MSKSPTVPSPQSVLRNRGDRPVSVSKSMASSTNPKTKSLIYSLIYTAMIINFLWVGLFKAGISQDPVRIMTQALPFIVLIQVMYSIVGLDGVVSKRTGTGPKKSTQMSSQNSSNFFSALWSVVIAIIMSFLVFGLLVLFGAPAFTYSTHTYLCALHISLLSVQPMFYVYNFDSNIWTDIISVRLPLNPVYGASVGTWLGSWLGAIPIPLDWDRPWQQWPITILAGAYIGTAIGTVVGALYKSSRKT
ncbi:hypothetical protein NADFUDRAFT_84411 [Nadsonia fulvescens var. elongata DSM 6958]|uniref:Glycosylphosphatidylinositol anchor biosynthesis protein 11 n=1 Tax=Nadsonia fulvescens var. elongata DSM 6958 TaxID=857566 RepID=A0A1E3PCW4_9ASCO|nr:hypothetical protein NADFUDRAFT_84411 [Nadsonia fulvescens var. elongata DSM 6958]